jgi:hypothetical protein
MPHPLTNLNKIAITYVLNFVCAGVLSEWRKVPAGQLERALGVHAGRDRHHPRQRRLQGEKGARVLRLATRRLDQKL